MFAVISRTAEEANVKADFLESSVVDIAVLNTLVYSTVKVSFSGGQVK